MLPPAFRAKVEPRGRTDMEKFCGRRRVQVVEIVLTNVELKKANIVSRGVNQYDTMSQS